ncbi:MAG: tape measure protein [Bacteroidota bacterium]
MPSKLLIRIGTNLQAFNQGLKIVERKLNRFSAKMERVGADLTTRVSAPLGAIGVAAVSTFAKFDKLEKGLTAITGSSKEAERQFDNLLNIVKDTRTTLDLKTASTASLQLQAVGRAAKSTENLLRQLGIAATVSGSSADDVGEVGRQLAQAAAKGSILQQELRIILERIPALAGVIKNEFGTVTAEGLREAGVGANEFIDRLTAAIESNERFQSVQGGLAKAIESFGINLQIAGARIGETISKTLNLEKNLQRLSDFILRTSDAFSELSPSTQKFIVGAAAAAVAIGPLLVGLGALSKLAGLGASGLLFFTNPLSALIKRIINFRAAFKAINDPIAKGVARSLAFGKAMGKVRAILAAFTGPIGIVIALGSAFAASYAKSETLRDGVSRLFGKIRGLYDAIANALGPALDGIGKKLDGLGINFGNFFGIVTGVFSFIIEAVNIVLEGLGSLAKSIKLLFDGEFRSAGQAFVDGISKITPIALITEAERLGNAFAGSFNDVVQQEVGFGNESFSFGSGSGSPTTPGGGGGSSGDPIRKSNEEFQRQSRLLNEIIAHEVNLQRIRDGIPANFQVVSEQVQSFGRTTQGLFRDLTRPIEQLGIKFQELPQQLTPAQESLVEYGNTLAAINDRSSAFGASFDLIGEKISATRQAIDKAFSDGFTSASENVQTLVGELNKLTLLDSIINGVTALGNEIENLAQRGALSFKSFANAALNAISDVIGGLIRQGVAAAVANAFKNPAGVIPGVGFALAGLAGAGASALFKSVISRISPPKLARGGIIPPGFSGDRFPALLNSGEAVIPIDRLMQAISEGSGAGEFVLRGDVLVAALKRANYNNARIAGG